MSHDNTAQAVLDAAPLVTLGSYDLVGTAEQAIAFAAGKVTLMSTNPGLLSTIFVDESHHIVGHAALAERVGVGAGADILATGGSGAAARAVWPGVAAAAGVVILGAVGTWYFVHKRKKARVATEDNQSGVETVLAEAEAVVDAESARLRQT